jgi:hypothetical protein
MHFLKSLQSFPATGLEGPLGFPEVEAPEFLDNQHMEVVRLSALGTGRPEVPLHDLNSRVWCALCAQRNHRARVYRRNGNTRILAFYRF